MSDKIKKIENKFWDKAKETMEAFTKFGENAAKMLENAPVRVKNILEKLEKKGREKMYRCNSPETGAHKQEVRKEKIFPSIEKQIQDKEYPCGKGGIREKEENNKVEAKKGGINEEIDLTETLREAQKNQSVQRNIKKQ